MNRIFAWKFCKARVQFPILGTYFLKHYGVIINTCNGTLNCVAEMTHSGSNNGADAPAVENNTNEFLNAVFGQEIKPDWSLERLLHRNSELFDLECFKQPPRHHTIKHRIRTKGPSVCGQVQKLSPEKLEILRQELGKLIDLGIIISSEREYRSPVHLVPKKEPGSYRVTGDFRMLNRQTIPDKYAIPLLTDFVDLMTGSTIFSSLDLNNSYHQIEVAEEDVLKTAILTPLGSFAFKKMPMGLTSAGNKFQRFMNEVTRGLTFVYVYIDDNLVFSKNEKEHFTHLALVFERLRQYGIILNKDKCILCILFTED